MNSLNRESMIVSEVSMRNPILITIFVTLVPYESSS